MPREIIVEWTTPSGSDHRSVTYWETSVAVASQRTALQTFLTAVKGSLTTQISYVIQTTGRELDDTTGVLTGAWTEASAKTGVGTSATQCVNDATQILIRWSTGFIVNGRFLRGRTFIPGLYSGGISGGNLLAAQVTALSGYAQTLATDAASLQVWHRPVGGAGGNAVQTNGGTCWSELAVLRRRR